jgi:hypothetical protein
MFSVPQLTLLNRNLLRTIYQSDDQAEKDPQNR